MGGGDDALRFGDQTAQLHARSAAQAGEDVDLALDEAGQGSSFGFARGVECLGVVADDFVEACVFRSAPVVCEGGCHAAASEQQWGRAQRMMAMREDALCGEASEVTEGVHGRPMGWPGQAIRRGDSNPRRPPWRAPSRRR